MIGLAVIQTWQKMGVLPTNLTVSAYSLGMNQQYSIQTVQAIYQDTSLPLQQGDDFKDRLTIWIISPPSNMGAKYLASSYACAFQRAIFGSLGDPNFYRIQSKYANADYGDTYLDVRVYPDSSPQTQTPPISGVVAQSVQCQIVYKLSY